MKIRGTVVCLPVRDLDKTLAFYQNALGFSDAQADEGIIVLELPNLSLFLMHKDAFESYTKKVGREAQFPDGNAGVVISCAMESREETDTVLENVVRHGGSVTGKAALDAAAGGYTGYFSDPDGHLWELVVPTPRPGNDSKLSIETTVHAPVATVWACWSKPEHIVNWAFASDDWEAPEAENDLREGGKFRTRMQAKDGSMGFDFTGTYTAVKEHEHIAYTMEDGRHVHVEFAETPEGVKITSIFDPEQENPPEMQRQGWQAILDNFTKYVETR